MAILKVAAHGRSRSSLMSALRYVLQESKTDSDDLCYVSGDYDNDTITPAGVYEHMMHNKWLWRKASGRMYDHMVISFPANEDISPESVLEFAEEFIERTHEYHTTLIAVHEDRDHLHAHMIIDTVSYLDGSKTHWSSHDLEMMKQIVNEMCEKRGLSLAEKGRHADGTIIQEGELNEYDTQKYQVILKNPRKSYLAQCMISVVDARKRSDNRDEFIEMMGNHGWMTTWDDKHKHIIFQDQDGHRVRDSNLQKTFNLKIGKDILEETFAMKHMIKDADHLRTHEKQHNRNHLRM